MIRNSRPPAPVACGEEANSKPICKKNVASNTSADSRRISVTQVGLIVVTFINVLSGLTLLNKNFSEPTFEGDAERNQEAHMQVDRTFNGPRQDLADGQARLVHRLNYTSYPKAVGENVNERVVRGSANSNHSVSFTQHHKGLHAEWPAALPKIALLMSFPNSGTSYTLKNVRLASRRATASNYCNAGPNETYIPVYPPESNILGPHFIKAAEDFDMPKSYILTKTHCGGFCMDCSPTGYKIMPEEFADECFRVCDEADTRHKERPKYRSRLVGKVVHLFRSPFDNVISRFHLHLNQATKRNDTDDLQLYSRDSEGLQAFCKDLDMKYRRKDKAHYAPRVYRWTKRVPCHADFVRYVQWHNLAFDMLQRKSTLKDVPVHILHYEDYHKDYNATVSGLLQFLELPWQDASVNEASFHWSDYSEYFTTEQRRAAMKLISVISSPETDAQLRRYAPKRIGT